MRQCHVDHPRCLAATQPSLCSQRGWGQLGQAGEMPWAQSQPSRPGTQAHQGLVEDAEHVGVVEQDV